MSRELFSRNPDLKRLRDEGYFVLRQGGHLVMREVPYVDARREVRIGGLSQRRGRLLAGPLPRVEGRVCEGARLVDDVYLDASLAKKAPQPIKVPPRDRRRDELSRELQRQPARHGRVHRHADTRRGSRSG